MKKSLLVLLLIFVAGCSSPEKAPISYAEFVSNYAKLQIEHAALETSYANLEANNAVLQDSHAKISSQYTALSTEKAALEIQVATMTAVYGASQNTDAERNALIAAANEYSAKTYALSESFNALSDEYQNVLDRYPKYFSSVSELEKWRADSGNFTSALVMAQSALTAGYIVGQAVDDKYALAWVGGSLLKVWPTDNVTWIKVR